MAQCSRVGVLERGGVDAGLGGRAAVALGRGGNASALLGIRGRSVCSIRVVRVLCDRFFLELLVNPSVVPISGPN